MVEGNSLFSANCQRGNGKLQIAAKSTGLAEWYYCFSDRLWILWLIQMNAFNRSVEACANLMTLTALGGALN